MRFGGGPALAVLGLSMLRGADTFDRVMGGVTIAFGIWYALKPLLAVHLLVRRRRASGAADRELTVTLDDEGVEIDDTLVRTRLGWSEVACAGEGADYVWFELTRGHRATIPLAAVEDVEALVARFREHTDWRG